MQYTHLNPGSLVLIELQRQLGNLMPDSKLSAGGATGRVARIGFSRTMQVVKELMKRRGKFDLLEDNAIHLDGKMGLIMSTALYEEVMGMTEADVLKSMAPQKEAEDKKYIEPMINTEVVEPPKLPHHSERVVVASVQTIEGMRLEFRCWACGGAPPVQGTIYAHYFPCGCAVKPSTFSIVHVMPGGREANSYMVDHQTVKSDKMPTHEMAVESWRKKAVLV